MLQLEIKSLQKYSQKESTTYNNFFNFAEQNCYETKPIKYTFTEQMVKINDDNNNIIEHPSFKGQGLYHKLLVSFSNKKARKLKQDNESSENNRAIEYK